MSILSASTLNTQFALDNGLQFRNGPGGLIFAHIDNGLATARVCLQGAQLLDWQPVGEKPVIWCSHAARYETGAAIRGGVPVCWPWFGAHPQQQRDAPAHGIARTACWRVIHSEALTDGRIRIDFELPCLDDNPLWPKGAQLQLSITVGRTLEMALLTENTGVLPITITQALHSYFVVGDIRQARVLGLENSEYTDKLDGASKQQSGAVFFDRETDRIYHSSGTQCVIDDPGLRRQIHIRTTNSGSTVVWTPWQEKSASMADMDDDAYLGMLCVETANVAHNEIAINAGQSHRLWSEFALW